jgi:hypothetical protein
MENYLKEMCISRVPIHTQTHPHMHVHTYTHTHTHTEKMSGRVYVKIIHIRYPLSEMLGTRS